MLFFSSSFPPPSLLQGLISTSSVERRVTGDGETIDEEVKSSLEPATHAAADAVEASDAPSSTWKSSDEARVDPNFSAVSAFVPTEVRTIGIMCCMRVNTTDFDANIKIKSIIFFIALAEFHQTRIVNGNDFSFIEASCPTGIVGQEFSNTFSFRDNLLKLT